MSQRINQPFRTSTMFSNGTWDVKHLHTPSLKNIIAIEYNVTICLDVNYGDPVKNVKPEMTLLLPECFYNLRNDLVKKGNHLEFFSECTSSLFLH